MAAAAILGGAFAANADTFTLDPPSPSLPLVLAGPGDLLVDVGGPVIFGPPPTPPTTPVIGVPMAGPGGMGLLPGDVVDAISDGMDPVGGMHDDYFSVTRGSVGVPGTGVNIEATSLDRPPGVTPGHAGDVFMAALLVGANLLAPSGWGWTLGTATGDEFNVGMLTPTIAPGAGDEVNAYDVATMAPGTAVLFSLAPGSPTLLLLGAGPADILAVGGPFGPIPVIFLPAGPALGLPPGADIDALAVAAFIPPGPVPGGIEYSLTAATAPLVPAALGSGATILGLAPGPVPVPVHAPPALGLLVMDDLDALDVDIVVPIFGCWDGIDNDGDFTIDMGDGDCSWPLDPIEGPDLDGDDIADGLDGDADGDGVLTLGVAACTLPGWAGTTAAACCAGPLLGTCATDNCPVVANLNQNNSDADTFGNACDTDDDGDGFLDLGNLSCTAPGAAGNETGAAAICCSGSGTGSCVADNCHLVAQSAAGSCDHDNDAIGDRCDPDLNQNVSVNAIDISFYKTRYNSTVPATKILADYNCNASVNALDISVFKAAYNMTPAAGRLDSCPASANLNCTGPGAPYLCCSDVDTGTCGTNALCTALTMPFGCCTGPGIGTCTPYVAGTGLDCN